MTGIGKSVIIFLAIAIAAVALISILAIANEDKSDSSVYTNESTINSTMEMTREVTGAGGNFLLNLVLISAIFVFAAVVFIFRRKKGG
jgi:hypothetical protein